MKYTAYIVQFDKVSGWTTGPLKPTANSSSGTASTVGAAASAAVNSSAVGALAAGESIHVIVTAENDS